MSYLNLPPLPFSFISLPISWNSFNMYHFYIYTCANIFDTVFTLLTSLCPTFSFPLVSTFPPGQDLFSPPVLQIYRRKKRKDKKKNITFNLLQTKFIAVSFNTTQT
jgi:hypothetical protein